MPSSRRSPHRPPRRYGEEHSLGRTAPRVHRMHLARHSVGVCAALIAISAPVLAQRTSAADWQWGVVLDAAAQSRSTALGLRDSGLGLGHSDLLLRGQVGESWSAEGIASFATHEGRLEKRVEKLFLQSRGLPAGLQVRGGRFASQIGYLNEQHPHADDFVERPLLYRSFLGHHYFDDGLRVNWTAPTPWYWQVGTEAFTGQRLSPEGRNPTVGVTTISTKLGADWGTSWSWQLGLSRLSNRRAAAHALEPGSEHADNAAEMHGHGARFTGRTVAMWDAAVKWAPAGNAREQQVRLVVEGARVSGLQDPGLQGSRHRSQSAALVWRFRPDWETGVRYDRLQAAAAHEGAAEPVQLREWAAMVVYKPSHRQSLRLQWTNQRNALGLDGVAPKALAVQYVVSFGAHGAHGY